MKTKIKVGIPRALLYYRYKILWKTFFTSLGGAVLVSPETNKAIVEKGITISPDESCLSYKIYLGHVEYLIDKCNYILIPRVSDYGRGEKVCVKFNALYDNVKNMYPTINILNYNIEKTKHHYQFFEFFKMGTKITKNPIKIIYAYKKAVLKQRQYNQTIQNNQKNILSRNKSKILIVSHPYTIYDNYLCKEIINYITENKIDILYADRLDPKISKEYAKELSSTLYWTYSKELIGAINYYKNNIKGIIFISTFPCGLDSLVNELMIRKITNIPKLNIIIDETSTEVGLLTRLESFVDILQGEKKWKK